ncbi:MAG: hypothetical protein INQ03_23295 [Candidatus Heimdallarchaeota archaeon]|nr:hypothetical protein [Candidatus Heimdallarchaeota archaeon]
MSFIDSLSTKITDKKLLLIILISFVVYSIIIAAGFVPISAKIEQSGYSTTDLQQAETREEVDIILNSWNGYMNEVRLLTTLDYLFILAGFVLFLSINLLLYKQFELHKTARKVTLLGMALTVLSRSLDAFEDLWALLIYNNPTTYPSYLIPLLNITESVKWIVVYVEYSVTLIGLGFYIILRLRKQL